MFRCWIPSLATNQEQVGVLGVGVQDFVLGGWGGARVIRYRRE